MKRLWRIWRCRKVILKYFRHLVRYGERFNLASLEDNMRVKKSRKIIDYIDGKCDIKGKYHGYE